MVCERGNGVSDYTTSLRAASQIAVDNDLDLLIEAGYYNYTDIQIMSSTTRQASTKWIAKGDVNLISIKTAPDSTDYDADYAIRFRGVFVKAHCYQASDMVCLLAWPRRSA